MKPAWVKKLEAEGIRLSARDIADVAKHRRFLRKFERDRKLREIARKSLNLSLDGPQ